MGDRRCELCFVACPDDEEWWLLEDSTVVCGACAQEFDPDDLVDPDADRELPEAYPLGTPDYEEDPGDREHWERED